MKFCLKPALACETVCYFIPNFCKTHIMGHQLVKADWIRLTPIKAVNQSHNGLT